MPGIFDNPPNAIGGILQGIGGALSPQFYQQNLQYRIMQNQYDALMRQPNMTPDRAIAIITDPNGPAAATQYGMHQFQGPEYGADTYKPAGPIYSGGQPIAGAPQVQPQPSQQRAGGVPPELQQALPIMDTLAARKATNAANVKSAEQIATAQPDLPILQNRAKDLIAKLDDIEADPNLPSVVSGILGVKGRLGPLGQGQSDLLSKIQDANNALQGDLFSSMRTMSNGGKPPSPGAMKEMRITDLNARTGTLQGYIDNLHKTKTQIQNEYEAAWKARQSPDAYKPDWGQSQQAFPTPQPAHIQALKANPSQRAAFDQKFGQGAAMRVLGQ